MIKLQYLKEQEKGFYVCCPICKTVLIRAQKGLDGVIKCSQCGMFVHVVITGKRMLLTKLSRASPVMPFPPSSCAQLRQRQGSGIIDWYLSSSNSQSCSLVS